MTRVHASAIVVAASLLLVAAPSRAETVSSAMLSGLKIQLIDLEPGDGIVPAISFDPRSHSTALAEFSYGPGANTFWGNAGAGPFAPVTSSGSMLGTGGTGIISGDPFGAGATFATTGYALPELLGGGGAYIQYDLGPNLFTLSAHTEILVTAIAVSSWAVDSPLAAVSNYFNLAVGDSLETLLPTGQDRFYNGYFGPGGGGDPTGSDTTAMSVFFINDGDAPLVGVYDFTVETSASDLLVPALPAVPELPVAPLLLAGLGVLGLAKRWR